jgi:ADP-ribose pyrophosphatase
MILAEDDVELPTGKTIKYLHQIYKGDGGVIIICIKHSQVLLQREYSYPVDEILYQFPGGRIEKGESYEDAAQRELAEESASRRRRVYSYHLASVGRI